MVIRL